LRPENSTPQLARGYTKRGGKRGIIPDGKTPENWGCGGSKESQRGGKICNGGTERENDQPRGKTKINVNKQRHAEVKIEKPKKVTL